MAENIEDYGGVKDTNTLSAAEDNVDAIVDAAQADDDNMVYLPEGDWYIGDSNTSQPLRFGNDNQPEPAGTGFTGDGPEKSFLIVQDDADVQFWRLRYSSDSTHPNTTWDNITYDCNVGNLNNYDPNSDAQWGMTIRNDGDFTFDNVRFRNSAANMIRTGGGARTTFTFDHCSWVNCGIENLSAGSGTGHAFVGAIHPGESLTIENSYFNLIGGTCVDLGSSTADNEDITVSNCYAEGVCDGFFKINASGDIDVSNVYHEARTSELINALGSIPINNDRTGRHFAYIVQSGAAPITIGITVNDVEARSLDYHCFQTQNDHTFEIRGGHSGPLAVHDSARLTTRNGALAREGPGDENFDFQNFGEVSVHDSDAEVFKSSNAVGSIDTLRRDGNDGLGETGDLTIGADDDGADAFQPDVPSRSDVGINPQDGDDSEDDDADEESDPVFDEWTPRRASSESDWSIAELEDSPLGEATLELEPDDGDPHALSIDRVGEPTDTEIVALCRIPSDDDRLSAFGRLYARGDESAEQWGWTSIARDSGDTYKFRIRINDGTITDLGEISIDDTAVSSVVDNWFWRRFEVTGDMWRMRAWDYDDEEPDSWDIEAATDRVSESGYVGTGGYSTDTQQFDYISVAMNGGSAQLPDSESSPAVSWEAPADSDTVSGTVPVRIAARDEDDDDSLTIEYSADGGSWSTATYDSETGYYEDEWDSTTIDDGERTLETRATDSSGNSATDSIDVIVENETNASVSVDSVGARGITEDSATLIGELTNLDDADEADVSFEWRISGKDDWNATGEKTIDSTGEFDERIDDLESDTDYEFRAIAEVDDDTDTGDTLAFTTESDDGNPVPVIEQFDLTDRSNPTWSWFEVDWTVSDEDGNLDTVVTKLLHGRATVDAESTNVSGETASFTHVMRVRGDVDEVRISVNDTENQVTSETKEV